MDIQSLTSMDLKKFSELNGGRKLRHFPQYHYKNYGTSGFTGQQTFFNVNGAQKDISGAPGTVLNVSNMVTAGRMDEPFLITHVAFNFINLDTTNSNIVLEYQKIMQSGRFELFVNNISAFERAPLGELGSTFGINGFNAIPDNGTAAGAVFNINRPLKLAAPIFVEENVAIKAICEWSTAQSITTASWYGVVLIGLKAFKN